MAISGRADIQRGAVVEAAESRALASFLDGLQLTVTVHVFIVL